MKQNKIIPIFVISVIVASAVLITNAVNVFAEEEAKPLFSVDAGNKVQIVSSPAIADIDLSYPGLEIAIGTWDNNNSSNPKGKMYVIHKDGTIASGWPVEISAQIGSSPAVGDIDNDGDMEVVVGSRNGVSGIYAWHHNGKSVAGWPFVTGSAWVASSPSLIDLDNDKDLEIIFATTYGSICVLHHDDKNNDGKPDFLAGWPVELFSRWLDSSPAVADINDDGNPEIVIADWEGMIYVLRKDGTVEPGWPRQIAATFYASAAVGNLDPDYPGLEIVIASKDERDMGAARIYALHSDGTFVPGWPVRIEYVSYASRVILSSPTVGDINGDGKLEVITASQDGRVYAYQANGQQLWYYDTGREIDSSAALADIDGNGDIEIIIGSMALLGDNKVAEKGKLYILNHDGTLHNQWLILDNGGNGIYSSPALGDIDGDGMLEVVFGSQGYAGSGTEGIIPGNILCYKLGRIKSDSKFTWLMFRHDRQHTGYCNYINAPQVGTISPSYGSSLPDVPVTFTTTYTDADGWQNIGYAHFLINTTTSSYANCFYGYYAQNTNTLYIRNDSGTLIGNITPGSKNPDGSDITLENSYIKLNCSQTTATGSGTTLTVKWYVTFKTAFVGTQVKNLYLYAVDDSGLAAGWTQRGTWLVGPNSLPALGAVSPAYGSSLPGTAITFTATYSDPNSWQDLKYSYLLINTLVSGINSFYAYYNQNENRLYLRNDANTAWTGGFAPGSANIIENSYAKLDCSKTTTSGSGNTLTVKWNITFKDTFSGSLTKNLYLYAADDSGLAAGWTQRGTWLVGPNTVPSLGFISPASGSSLPEQATTFTTTYTDPNGWQDLKYSYLLINTLISGANGFYAYYNQNENKLYLRNDANTTWTGGFAPGSTNTIENSYAKLNCAATTASGSATTLTVKWNITFKSSFVSIPTKYTYLYAADDSGLTVGWTQKGTWLVGSNSAPAVGTLTPASGSSSANTAVTFTTTYADSNGWQDIAYAHFLVNTTTSSYANCFYGYYAQNTNTLYIRNDAGTLIGGFAPGSANIIENSYAKLDCSKTTVSGSGTTLTLNWNITFKPTFTGAKNAYLYLRDDSNLTNGWVKKGTWTVN